MQDDLPYPDLYRVYEYSGAILKPMQGIDINLTLSPCAYSQNTLIEVWSEDGEPIDWAPSGKDQEQIIAHVEAISRDYAFPITYRAAVDHVVMSRVLESAETSDDACLVDFTNSTTIMVGGIRGLGFRKLCPKQLERNMNDADSPGGCLQMQAYIEGELHDMHHQGTVPAACLENYADFEEILEEVEDLIEAVIDLHHNEDRSLRTATLSVLSRDPETGCSLRSVYASCLMASEQTQVLQ